MKRVGGKAPLRPKVAEPHARTQATKPSANAHGRLTPATGTRLAATSQPWYLAWLDRLIAPATADDDFGLAQHPATHPAEHPARPVPPALILMIRHRPDQPAQVEPVTPEQVLQALLSSQAVIRALTQSKLEALVRWVSTVPAYALRYPDLASGLALAESLVARIVADP